MEICITDFFDDAISLFRIGYALNFTGLSARDPLLKTSQDDETLRQSTAALYQKIISSRGNYNPESYEGALREQEKIKQHAWERAHTGPAQNRTIFSDSELSHSILKKYTACQKSIRLQEITEAIFEATEEEQQKHSHRTWLQQLQSLFHQESYAEEIPVIKLQSALITDVIPSGNPDNAKLVPALA